MKCCNLKTLSYISASLQLVVFLLLVVWSILMIVGTSNLDGAEGARALVFISFVGCVFYSSLLIMLLLGLKQNRMQLIGIFLHAAHGILAIGIIYMIYELIMGIVHKQSVDAIVVHLLLECVCIGFEAILTAPIHMLHSRMHTKSSGDEESSAKEDCCKSCDLEGNI